MFRRVSFTAVAGIIVLSAVTARSQPIVLDDEELIVRTAAVIDWAMQRPGAVALSVAVARDGEALVDRGLGMASLELGVPANRETIFRIGSVTKQFTAAAIMKLVERGELALDDDIIDYLPDFDSGGRAITIRRLLNHTSGVPSYTSQPDFFPRASPLDLTHQELLAWIDDVPFDFEPGEGWNYSNTGYYLLGMIVETIDGRSYGDFVEAELFAPLGLSGTHYGSEREILPNRAQGYEYDAASGSFFNDALISMNTPGAAGALVSTAGDLVRWQIALRSGRAVEPASYETMITSTVPTGQGPTRYGFGLMVAEVDGVSVISHGGGIPGFNSVLMTVPERELHIAVISNSSGLTSELVANNIMAALSLAEPPPLPEARTSANPESEATLRRLIGELARGAPDYERMSPQLAAATRAQLPAMQARFEELGSIQSIDFAAVGPAGQDIFTVAFENGALVLQILLDETGRVVGAGMRPAEPAAQ